VTVAASLAPAAGAPHVAGPSDRPDPAAVEVEASRRERHGTGGTPQATPIAPQGTVMGRGAAGPAVTEWQRLVNLWIRQEVPERGEIAVDGFYGRETAAATSDVQRGLGVAVDGIAGPDTRAALTEALAAGPDGGRSVDPGGRPLLARGQAGEAVTAWQRELNTWRRHAGSDVIAEDGVFGLVTESATRQFQAASDVLVDGIVGPDTRSALADHPRP
jgi:peptidoglycan hydrolase-like protein with peptidoglycan-binding domain